MLCGITAGITLLELALPVVLQLVVAPRVLSLDLAGAHVGAVVAGVAAVAYVTGQIVRLWHEKKLRINVVNQVREVAYFHALGRPNAERKMFQKGRLIARITYHLGLLQLGLGNALFGAIKGICLLVGLLVISALFSPLLLLFMLFMTGLAALCVFVGYRISIRQISRMTTMSSHIVRHVVESLSDPSALRSHDHQLWARDTFQNLVDIDSHYRLRREVWLQAMPFVLGVLVTLVVGLWGLLTLWFPAIDLRPLGSPILLYGTLGLSVELLYLSLRFGLYLFPLRLGLLLLLPESGAAPKVTFPEPLSALSFSSSGLKLPSGKKKKPLQMAVQFGAITFVQTPEIRHAQYAYRVFSGQLNRVWSRPLMVHRNGEKQFYKEWARSENAVLALAPLDQGERTTLSYLLHKPELQVTQDDIAQLSARLAPIMHLVPFLGQPLGASFDVRCHLWGWQERCMLELLRMYLKPEMVGVFHPCMESATGSEYTALLRHLTGSGQLTMVMPCLTVPGWAAGTKNHQIIEL